MNKDNRKKMYNKAQSVFMFKTKLLFFYPIIEFYIKYKYIFSHLYEKLGINHKLQ